MTVRPEQRHKRRRPCVVCGGGDDDRRGQSKRCSGFISDDGEWEHCSREELAGGLDQEAGGTFAHRMSGPCRCGVTHGEAKSGSRLRSGEPEATYDYTDERGAHLFQVVRFPDKTFRQRRLVGGQWLWETKGVRRTLYHLKALIEADPSKTVFIVEGEKDVESLERLGYLATCNPGGAGKWSYVAKEAEQILRGRHIIVVADADTKGRTHATDIARALVTGAESLRIVEATPHKDVTELIESGGSVDAMVEPPPEPPSAEWNVVALDDLAKPLPPVPWVCKSLGLAPGAVSLTAGYGYSRKTMALQSLGLAIAAGKPAWGVYATRQGPFVHLDYEQGRRLTQERYQRLARGMGFELLDLPKGALRVACMPRIYLDEKDIADELVKLVDGAVFVLVDSLRAAFPHADENSSEVRSYLDVLSRVSERTGALFDVIHHARKPSNDEKAGGETYAIRGSSALFDACQSVHVFIGAKDTPTTVHHQKDRIRGACADTFGLTGEDIPSGNDPRWGLRVVHLEPEQLSEAEKHKEDAKLGGAVRAIETTIRKAGGSYACSKKDLLSLSGLSNREDRAVALAMASGRLLREGTYHEPIWRWV
jgi:5S rRNA maturation endonuclease (ribonuclease M5)